MGQREVRMRSSREFGATVRTGRRVVTDDLVTHVAVADHTRVGFVVSKAVGNAVTRNRVKRRLRHVVDSLLPDVHEGAHVVIRARASAASVTSREFGEQLASSLRRAGVR